MYLARALLLAAPALLAGGCYRSASWMDARDGAEPLMLRARDRVNEGDVKGAIRLYTEALDRSPDLARAHLELALLYHDREKDCVRAIYHYRRYLEARPDTEKSEMIEDRIRLAGQWFAASIIKPERYAADKAAIEKENEDLRNQVNILTQEVVQLRQACVQYQTSLAGLRQEAGHTGVARTTSGVTSAVTRADPPRTGSGSLFPRGRTDLTGRDRPPEGGSVSTNAAARTIRTYRVKAGDSLSTIAGQVYEDPSQWPRTHAANRKILGESRELKAGQVLVIP